MEDPDPKWEIQEYSSLNEAETNVVRWILTNGYGIGRRLVITSIVISSAPLVLLPLVASSVIGVVFLVPSGLMFVTYACTNKLMSLLLPLPPSRSLSYYGDEHELDEGCDSYSQNVEDSILNTDGITEEGTCYINGDEVEQETMLQDEDELTACIEQGYDDYNEDAEALITNEEVYINNGEDLLQEEEDERIEDIRHGVEIGLLKLDEGCDDSSHETEALSENANGIVDEKGYDTDEDEKEGEDGVLGPETVLQEEDMSQGVGLDEVGVGYMQETDDLITNVDEKIRHTNENEGGDGFLRRKKAIKEEEKEQLEDIKQGVKMRLELTEDGPSTVFNGSVDEEERKGEEPLHRVITLVDENEENNDEEEEIVRESTGLLENIRDEGRVHDNSVEDDNDILGESGSHGPFEEDKKVEITEPVKVNENESRKLVEDGRKSKEELADNNEMKMDDFEEKIMRESTGSLERFKKKDLIDSNANANEVHMFDDRNAATYENRSMNMERHEANDEVTENVASDNVDVVALPAEGRSKLDSDHANIASKTDTKASSKEEKIWEEIGAMRMIVGYRAARQATCVEELKALYMFTGVEPPASINGLDEVNAKLKFLMSIVGVK